MTDAPDDQRIPGDQEPAEGSRETVDASLEAQEPSIGHDEEGGVSDYVPDA